MMRTDHSYMGKLLPTISGNKSGDYPIPSRLNLVIIILCTITISGLFLAGTYLNSLWPRLLLALIFAIAMIPVYSLMHEAAHNTLHASNRWNIFLGRWLCCMFIIPFTFYRHCHLRHHKKNRTDEEMWDLYYEHQNRWLRYGNLYGMMIGLGYLANWLAVIILILCPSVLNSSIFRRHNEIKGFLEGFTTIKKLKIARAECLVILLCQCLLLILIQWDFRLWLTFYLVHGFVWSSQNYVNHAFSPRDIINGGHNLKLPPWLKLIYLNFNIHLAHHQHPNIPWIYLPSFIRSGTNRIAFYTNYLRLWKGPELTTTPEPKPAETTEDNALSDGGKNP